MLCKEEVRTVAYFESQIVFYLVYSADQAAGRELLEECSYGQRKMQAKTRSTGCSAGCVSRCVLYKSKPLTMLNNLKIRNNF